MDYANLFLRSVIATKLQKVFQKTNITVDIVSESKKIANFVVC